jgi:hypothetical protein
MRIPQQLLENLLERELLCTGPSKFRTATWAPKLNLRVKGHAMQERQLSIFGWASKFDWILNATDWKASLPLFYPPTPAALLL